MGFRTPKRRPAQDYAELRDKPSRTRAEELRYAEAARAYAVELGDAGRRDEALAVGAEAVAASRAAYTAQPARHRRLHGESLVSLATLSLAGLPASLDEIRTLTDEAFAVLRPWRDDRAPARVRLVSRAYATRGHAELEVGEPATAEPLLWRAHETACRFSARYRTTPENLRWWAGVVSALARCRRAAGDTDGGDQLAAQAHKLAEAAKGMARAGKELRAAVSDVRDTLRGRAVRAPDNDG